MGISRIIVSIIIIAIGILFFFNNKNIGKGAYWFYQKFYTEKNLTIMFMVLGILFYGINFILNILWSIFFFYLKQPKLVLVEIIILWISILYLVIFTWKIEKRASYLLIPYLAWVSFAFLLNYLIVF